MPVLCLALVSPCGVGLGSGASCWCDTPSLLRLRHILVHLIPFLVGGLWARMPKGGGNKKGKQPALRPQHKRPAPAPLGSEVAGGAVDRGALLAQVEALERALGLSASGPPAGSKRKRVRVTRHTSPDLFHSQMQQRLAVVTERAASIPVVTGVDASRTEDVGHGQLVPAGSAATLAGASGEYGGLPPPGSSPWGPRGVAASSGSSGVDQGLQDGALGSPPRREDTGGMLAGGGALGAAVSQVSMGGSLGVGPTPVEGSGGSPQLPVLPDGLGPSAPGGGLLQADVLTQLIAAVIVGVAPSLRLLLRSRPRVTP